MGAASAQPATFNLAALPQTAAVRRTDVTLRAAFPQLQTRIFQLSPFAYRIVFERAVLRAEQIRDEFQNSIRPMTLQIDVSNDVPASFLQEIPSMSDHEIALGFAGFPFNREDLRTILLGKFPELPELVAVGNPNPPTIKLSFVRELTEDEQSKIKAFFDGWESGWPIEFAFCAPPEDPGSKRPPITIPGDILRFRPVQTRPHAPKFVREDEAFWFDHIETIFSGGCSPSTILDVENVGMACYLDGSTFPQIDLRQLLICYDTIFFSPPLIDGPSPSFWDQQTIKRDDVLELIAADRLRLVLRQPEERTDVDFLSSAYDLKPESILGRRKAAALLAADLVQTADEYRFSDNRVIPHIQEIASHLAAGLSMPEREIIEFLLWPNSARRACLLPLMTSGLMSLGAFGPGRLLGDQLQRVTGRDLQLEALATSDGVHIAHVLNATFVPPSEEMAGWIAPRQIVGQRLNFYRSFNTRIAAVWAANERRREEKIRILPPIPVFEFNRRAKVSELIKLTSYQSTRRKGRALLTRLSELPPEEREAEIHRLCDELYEFGRRKEHRALILDRMDDVKEVGLALAGQALPPLRSAWHIIHSILSVGRSIPAMDNFLDDLEHDMTPQKFRNDDLDFLSKVNRVAELREL